MKELAEALRVPEVLRAACKRAEEEACLGFWGLGVLEFRVKGFRV